MPENPRILLVIDEATVGGGQHHVLWLAEGLAQDNYDVAVVCEPQGYLVDELRSAGIRHLAVQMGNRFSIRSVMQTVRTIREFDPDIVHTHGGTAGVYGRIAARVLGRRVVHTYHGIHYIRLKEKWKKQVYLLMERFLVRWSDAIICVANSDLQLALQYGLAIQGNVFMIPNGINAGKFKSVGKKAAKRKKTIIGTIGRLHEQKGHTYLLKAAARVSRDYKNVEFRFIGDGELRAELEQETRGLDLDGIVRFLGSRTDVQSELNQCDLFVLPSLWEGMPFVILEAMSAGVPIVASSVDGIAEILEDGKDALLVPPKDPQRLAEAIAELIRSRTRAQRLAAHAAKKIKDRFDVSTMVRQTERVYQKVSDGIER